MNVIRNKLRAKDGASIFMGLMFLMVCLMVGAVVLAAATAAAGKLAELRENEQNYLNVASAARMVKDRICALTYESVQIDGGTPTVNLTASSDTDTIILKEELTELCNNLISADTATPVSAPAVTEKKFTITSAVEDLDTVYGSIRMEADWRIIVELWLGKEDRAAKGNHNFMEIELCPEGPVTKKVVDETESDTTDGSTTVIQKVTVTKTCSWPETGCTITKGKVIENETSTETGT